MRRDKESHKQIRKASRHTYTQIKTIIEKEHLKAGHSKYMFSARGHLLLMWTRDITSFWLMSHVVNKHGFLSKEQPQDHRLSYFKHYQRLDNSSLISLQPSKGVMWQWHFWNWYIVISRRQSTQEKTLIKQRRKKDLRDDVNKAYKESRKSRSSPLATLNTL